MKKTVFGALVLSLMMNISAVTVNPDQAVIVVDKQADGVVRFAAQELQKYLQMITGTKIAIADKPVPGKYPFLFGTPAGVSLKPEEARWEVTEKYTRLYGDSAPTGSTHVQLWKILNTKTKTGDLTAVYDFLEKQLGVLFLAPGKDGVSYEETKILNLKEGRNSWTPQLASRFMWPDRASWAAPRFYDQDGRLKEKRQSLAPTEFLPPTRAEYMMKEQETRLWLKQQRMGEHGEKLNSGHAFTKWWSRFGKTHPEYFALVNGKRRPPSRPNWVKLCVSNPAVWKQIVADWAADKNRSRFINVCENDGYGFCECAECRKLDMPPRPGKKWSDDLSDRYVYFANQVLKEARKIDPQAMVCQYGYSLYRFPPRREKVSSASHIIYVPTMMEFDRMEKDYRDWRAAGAKHFLLRPNDLHVNTSLPMGFDLQIYSAFKTGIKYGVVGTSYDSLHGFWDISGLADYVIARGHVDPSKSHDHWVTEYCSAYGPAAPEARAYFDYFRTNIWEKRILPHREAIAKAGNNGNFRLGLMSNIKSYYNESDFDAVEKILRKGLEKKLSPQQKRRLETLLLVNEHSRLTFRAIAARGPEKVRAAVKLLQFRRANKDRLNINWERLFNIEARFGDCTGIKAAELLGQYDEYRDTPQWWGFRLDPENAGEKEKWHELPYRKLFRKMVRTDAHWEQQKYLKDEAFKAQLENYDGIAYYGQLLAVPAEWKGKEIFLVFGAVDESAWVYVNGKFAGSHVFASDNDWKTPFAIPITEQIDWNQPKQTVTVRVEDKTGLGGIWRPVRLTVREKQK